MRVMVLVKATKESEGEVQPGDEKILKEMGAFNEQLVKALRQGDIQGLVVQDPFKMGYLGVMTAVAVLRHEKVAPSIDTGVGLVTAENMDDPAVSALIHPPLAEYLK